MKQKVCPKSFNWHSSGELSEWRRIHLTIFYFCSRLLSVSSFLSRSNFHPISQSSVVQTKRICILWKFLNLSSHWQTFFIQSELFFSLYKLVWIIFSFKPFSLKNVRWKALRKFFCYMPSSNPVPVSIYQNKHLLHSF